MKILRDRAGYATVLAAVTVLLSGCAPHGQREATQLSRVLLGQTITYQNQIATKVRTEETTYRNRVQDIARGSVEQADVAEDNAINRAAQDFHAAVVGADKDVQPRDVREAMLAVVTAINNTRREQAEARQAAIEGFAASVEALEVHQRALNTVRKDLEQLQAEQTSIENIKEWISFGRDVESRLKKDAKKPNEPEPEPVPPAASTDANKP